MIALMCVSILISLTNTFILIALTMSFLKLVKKNEKKKAPSGLIDLPIRYQNQMDYSLNWILEQPSEDLQFIRDE